ncbi:Spc7 kinetochore protein-domain-containing protein [Piptocephalis cylindrospora]|uniref:Spc7 kinetochore protein-domain-containing protein n=1 Tax=Piptocephalis cylindrospora TaxID=1907219 RepID=A0A4P9Y295_9FUNG|nr:Spc7 kinetochore protein-domain-containing protein [Piptocephalis cylindrospora]|eukprot:RKP12935.1 Spc7 kinetochore protein-domain-containing protein [Piptocephalis cylindrospora]
MFPPPPSSSSFLDHDYTDLELIRTVILDSPMLEFVKFACTDLRNIMEKFKANATALASSIDAANPLLVQEYLEGGMEERLEIQQQIQRERKHCRLTALDRWYRWVDGVRPVILVTYRENYEKLSEEYQRTKKYNSLLDRALPSVRATHQQLRAKLDRIKQRMERYSSQLKIFQLELDNHKKEKSRLTGELEEVETQKQSVVKRIEDANATCKESHARSLTDLQEIREEYQLQETMTPWEMKRLTDDAGQVDLVMNADRKVFVQLKRTKSQKSEQEGQDGGVEWSIRWGGSLEHGGAREEDAGKDEDENADKCNKDGQPKGRSHPDLTLPMSPGHGLATNLYGIRRALLMVMHEWRGRSLLMDDLVRLSSLYRVRVQQSKGDGTGVRVEVEVVDVRKKSIYSIFFHLPSSHLNRYPGHPLHWTIRPRKGEKLSSDFEDKVVRAMEIPGDQEGKVVYGRMIEMVKALERI